MTRLARFGLFAAAGAVAGVAVSLVSSQLGSSCTIVCNQWLAGGFGAALGGIMSLDKPEVKSE